MKHKQKNRRATWLLSLAAAVLLMSNFYVGRAEEPDPRILWVADSAVGIINGFAVHPNGNVFAYRYNTIFEIDGANGKILRSFVVPNEYNDISSIAISEDGKYLATSYDGVVITDLLTLNSTYVGKGNRVTFVTNSTKIAYRGSVGGSNGTDSSIVIFDFQTQERTYIKTEEMIEKISFSPDGKYMATSGTKEKNDGYYYTVFKLWDAKTMKLIKEIEKFDNHEYQIGEIKFSPDGNLIAFKGSMGLNIYDLNNYSLFKHYDNNIIGDYLVSLEFIENMKLVIQAKKTAILNLENDSIHSFFELIWRSRIKLNNQKSKLYICSFNESDYGPICCLDFNYIMTDVVESKNESDLKCEYNQGILNIAGIINFNSHLTIEIFDIQGHQLKHLDLQTNTTELKIPVKLPTGTYLIRINDTKSEYSLKFIVTK